MGDLILRILGEGVTFRGTRDELASLRALALWVAVTLTLAAFVAGLLAA